MLPRKSANSCASIGILLLFVGNGAAAGVAAVNEFEDEDDEEEEVDETISFEPLDYAERDADQRIEMSR